MCDGGSRVLRIIFVLVGVGRHPVLAGEPAAQIDVGASDRAKRTQFRRGRFAADGTSLGS
jgi:hypothetical protein